MESERQNGVEEFYRTNHINQTVDFVSDLPNWFHFLTVEIKMNKEK